MSIKQLIFLLFLMPISLLPFNTDEVKQKIVECIKNHNNNELYNIIEREKININDMGWHFVGDCIPAHEALLSQNFEAFKLFLFDVRSVNSRLLRKFLSVDFVIGNDELTHEEDCLKNFIDDLFYYGSYQFIEYFFMKHDKDFQDSFPHLLKFIYAANLEGIEFCLSHGLLNDATTSYLIDKTLLNSSSFILFAQKHTIFIRDFLSSDNSTDFKIIKLLLFLFSNLDIYSDVPEFLEKLVYLILDYAPDRQRVINNHTLKSYLKERNAGAKIENNYALKRAYDTTIRLHMQFARKLEITNRILALFSTYETYEAMRADKINRYSKTGNIQTRVRNREYGI